jgi:hypothetical protein
VCTENPLVANTFLVFAFVNQTFFQGVGYFNDCQTGALASPPTIYIANSCTIPVVGVQFSFFIQTSVTTAAAPVTTAAVATTVPRTTAPGAASSLAFGLALLILAIIF